MVSVELKINADASYAHHRNRCSISNSDGLGWYKMMVGYCHNPVTLQNPIPL